MQICTSLLNQYLLQKINSLEADAVEYKLELLQAHWRPAMSLEDLLLELPLHDLVFDQRR